MQISSSQYTYAAYTQTTIRQILVQLWPLLQHLLTSPRDPLDSSKTSMSRESLRLPSSVTSEHFTTRRKDELMLHHRKPRCKKNGGEVSVLTDDHRAK